MPESRSERRKARYKYLRDLGFSSAEATKLRDQSGLNIEKAVNTERRRISRKQRRNRTQKEQERLSLIQLQRESTPEPTRARRIKSRGDRYSDFSAWSGAAGFPAWAQDRIRGYNKARRLDPEDSFGYRRFYYWYVERIADFENEFFADRGDSGIRNDRGIPLKSRRPVRKVAA